MKENKYLIFRQSTPNNPKKQKSLFPNKKCLKTKSYPIKYCNYMSLTKLPSPFINVFCRFRPINELEYLYSKVEGVKIKSSTNLLLKEKNTDKFSREYKFSEIFEQNIHVSSFYNKTCKNIINAVIQGYNGAIILFGDTDKSKVYILKEVIPQIIIQIYQNIPLSNIDDEIFKIELGMYEVYQSQIINLVKMKKILELNNNKDEENNKIIYVNCDNASDMEDAIRNGLNRINKENKDMKCDEVNLIIEIKIYRYDKSKNLLKSGKLELIKLENLEEEYLNKNLDSKKENQINNNTLINSLSSIIQDIENKKDYDNDKIIENNDKENKLISILKNCLGGNSYTNLILSCSKSEYNIENTKNLFEISKNIQKIKNNPIINVKIMTDSDPFIEELLMNNINKISKLSHDNSNKIKNIYRIANNINYKFKYLSEEKENDKFDDYEALNADYSYSEKKIKNQISLLNRCQLNNYQKNKKISDFYLNNNYYPREISKYKKEINQLKLKIKEKENQVLELNNELNDKRANIILLSLEKEKILNRTENKLLEKDEQLLLLEKDINYEKKRMENNLYSQIKSSEAIIREIIGQKEQKDEIINRYKDNLEKYNQKMKELEMKYKECIDDNKQKDHEHEFEINNYKMKISQLTNDIFLKDSMIKKMQGEIQILKSELSNINNTNYKNNSIQIPDKEIQNSSEDKKLIEKYSSKIKDLQNELNSIKLKENENNSLKNHNLLKINELESQLKENQITIDEYKNKYNIINTELNDAKNVILNLQMENANIILEKNKELLLMNKNKNDIEIKNKEQEKELEELRQIIQNLKNENDNLKKKKNYSEGIKNLLEKSKDKKNNNNIEIDNIN